jgi:hypothetical protein
MKSPKYGIGQLVYAQIDLGWDVEDLDAESNKGTTNRLLHYWEIVPGHVTDISFYFNNCSETIRYRITTWEDQIDESHIYPSYKKAVKHIPQVDLETVQVINELDGSLTMYKPIFLSDL